MIDSRAVVEAAYAPLAERAATLDPADYQAAAEALSTELTSDAPDCEGPLADAEALFRAAGLEPLPRDQFSAADGRFDACMYAEWTRVLLGDISASLEATGIDAISRAYRALSFNRSPVGTGPFRFASIEEGTRVKLEAFAGYHLGPPATPRFEVRLIRDAAAVRDGLRSGELDWVAMPPDLYAQVENEPDLRFGIYPDAVYYMLAYNLREGMLFAEHDLRTAVELCIDKPATVEAATDGNGDVIYTPIDPVSWAYQPDIPRSERDVEGARQLIESAGWAEAEDGVYEREGVRLATEVYVRGDVAERVAFMDLVAEQVRDCGIELTVVPADPETVLGPLQEYPHIPGGGDEPFQAIFLGFEPRIRSARESWHSSTTRQPTSPSESTSWASATRRSMHCLDAGVRHRSARAGSHLPRSAARAGGGTTGPFRLGGAVA